MLSFVALDFETADRGRDSACAIGLVRVEGERIVARAHRLIRPPRTSFEFTWCHGITWSQVKSESTFGPVWRSLEPLLEGADFIAAHNASFDKSVLSACCTAAGLAPPPHRFECTVKLARKTWNLRPTTLPHVCTYLGISLQHHQAQSDAEACARIVLAAGVPVPPAVPVKAAPRRKKQAGAVLANG
jgi:DNA polymerase-3 subunit epsilon